MGFRVLGAGLGFGFSGFQQGRLVPSENDRDPNNMLLAISDSCLIWGKKKHVSWLKELERAHCAQRDFGSGSKNFRK